MVKYAFYRTRLHLRWSVWVFSCTSSGRVPAWSCRPHWVLPLAAVALFCCVTWTSTWTADKPLAAFCTCDTPTLRRIVQSLYGSELLSLNHSGVGAVTQCRTHVAQMCQAFLCKWRYSYVTEPNLTRNPLSWHILESI